MVEVSCFVVLDRWLFASSVYQFWTDDVQAFHGGLQLCRSSIVAQENTVSVGGIVDVASGSHSVKQDVKVLAATCYDDVDCGNIFGLIPFEVELWSLWLSKGDTSEEHRELCGSCKRAVSESMRHDFADCGLVHTEDQEFNSQKEPGKTQSIGWLDCLLGDDQAIYAVSEVRCKGQNAQHCRWWHEHPGMVIERHDDKLELAKGQPLCIRTVYMPSQGGGRFHIR